MTSTTTEKSPAAEFWSYPASKLLEQPGRPHRYRDHPYSPVAAYLGFEPLPASLLAMIAFIVLLYVATAEIAKRYFYRWTRSDG